MKFMQTVHFVMCFHSGFNNNATLPFCNALQFTKYGRYCWFPTHYPLSPSFLLTESQEAICSAKNISQSPLQVGMILRQPMRCKWKSAGDFQCHVSDRHRAFSCLFCLPTCLLSLLPSSSPPSFLSIRLSVCLESGRGDSMLWLRGAHEGKGHLQKDRSQGC